MVYELLTCFCRIIGLWEIGVCLILIALTQKKY